MGPRRRPRHEGAPLLAPPPLAAGHCSCCQVKSQDQGGHDPLGFTWRSLRQFLAGTSTDEGYFSPEVDVVSIFIDHILTTGDGVEPNDRPSPG